MSLKKASISFMLFAFAVTGAAPVSLAQESAAPRYEIGNPALQELWVDPQNGNDSRNGSSRSTSLRTVAEAWNRIPQGETLSLGYRINLTAGTYAANTLPNYWESRHGTESAPIIIRGVDGREQTVFESGPNIFDSRYVYLLDFSVIPVPAGDAFHCEQCDHVLLRGMVFNGGVNQEAQETIKVNQSSYFYVEDSDISGASDNAVDFVSVQHGHLARNRIHNANDWCVYTKGGSAYLSIEGNRIYDCGTGGYTAGQGTGFEFMSAPWLHYEAYNIKFINNVVHDTEGAGFGVNGGYNILLAHNTLYRVGRRSHGIEVVFGARSCDGNSSACASRIAAGGWGTSLTGDHSEPIPNRNIFIYNNVLYNPTGYRSDSQHFAIYGPSSASPGSNISSPARSDTNLQIRGNVIWNGPADLALGIEESDQGCQPTNPTCNETLLRSENTINSVEPQLVNPVERDFRPVESGNLFSALTFPIPAFIGGDLPALPVVPQGNLSNAVSRDRSGAERATDLPPGAYATSSASLDEIPLTPAPTDRAPTFGKTSCSPRSVKPGTTITCSVVASDDHGRPSVTVVFADRYRKTMKYKSGKYSASWKLPRLSSRSGFSAVAVAKDSANQTTGKAIARFKWKR